jgi:PAS domain S-box-containing protein
MIDAATTQEQLLEEVAQLRRRLAAYASPEESRPQDCKPLPGESADIPRIILENISDAIFITDDIGNLTYIGPNADKIFGYSAAEIQALGNITALLGRRLINFADLERLGEISNIEHDILAKNGRTHSLLINFKRISIQGGTVLYVCRDITDRQEMEQALRDSEKQYRLLFHHNPQPMWTYDLQTLAVLEVNEAAVNHYGYSRDEFLQLTIKDLVPPAEVPALLEIIKNLKPGIAHHYDHRHQTKDGLIKFVEVASHDLVFQGKRSRCVMVHDITAHKQGEEALRQEKLYADNIINCLPGVFYMFDDQGNSIRWNKRLAEVTGYSPTEIATRHATDFFEGPEKDIVLGKMQLALTEGYVDAELTLVTKMRKKIPYFFTGARMILSGRNYIIGFGIDITERQQADKAMCLNRGRLEALLALGRMAEAPVSQIAGYALEKGVSLTSSRIGLLILFNETGMPDLYVYPPAEDAAYRTNFFDLKVLWDEALQNKQTIICQKSAPPLPFHPHPALYNYVSVPIFEGHSLIAVALVGNKDETDDYHETDIQQLQLLMEGMWTIIRNQKIRDQLRQNDKLASLGLLVSGVAHEINNPNNFITFNLPILRDYLQQILPIIDNYAEQHHDLTILSMPYREWRTDLLKLLGNLEHGSSRINQTVSALREFAREGKNKEKDWIDPRQAIERGVNLCKSQLQRLVRSLDIDIAPDLPKIFCIPQSLEQVLVNLLINASQAADKTDSYIKIKAVLPQGRPEELLLEISDNGCGISPEHQKKIFDPFFTTKPTGEGTGLGLSICHRLVEELGGRIEVNSKLGRGSTFRILLPLVPQLSD